MSILATAAPVIDRIGYVEAWGLWFGGEQLKGDAVLWFMSLRWWGRAGKLLTFLGGATVILDIVDPVKLRNVPKQVADKAAMNAVTVGMIIYLLALGIPALVASARRGNFWSVSNYGELRGIWTLGYLR